MTSVSFGVRTSTHEDYRSKAGPPLPSERSFAVVWAVVLAGVGLWPLWRGTAPRWWVLGVAGGVALLGWLWPVSLRWPNRGWFYLGLLLGKVVTPVLMAVMFYGVFTPMGLMMRLFRKDPLGLRKDPDTPTYWIPREPPGPDPETMKNQF